MLKVNTRFVGKEIVDAKLRMAAPRILEQNRLMVTQMLDEVKKTLVAETPVGPGHFGYHLKDSYKVDVKSGIERTIGVLKAPAQGYWREYGTKGQFARRGNVRAAINRLGHFSGGGGEPALMLAHKALSGVKKFLKFYYGNAQWWRV